MPKLAEVLKTDNLEIAARQELQNDEWLLLVGPKGSISFPTPVYPSYIIYAESRDPEDISEEVAAAIHRRFNPPLLPGFKKP